MGHQRKHKKFFYVPGIISLVLIPFACIAWLFLHQDFDPENAMDLPMMSKHQIEEIKNKYGAFPIPRKYQQFEFNKTEHITGKPMQSLRAALHKLKQTKDTINGVQVHFGKRSDYQTFVNVLDLIAIEKVWLFHSYNDNIWVSNPPLPKNAYAGVIPSFTCGYVPDYKRLVESEKAKTFALYKKYPLLFGGWGMLFCLNIFLLIKRHRNKTYLQKPYI